MLARGERNGGKKICVLHYCRCSAVFVFCPTEDEKMRTARARQRTARACGIPYTAVVRVFLLPCSNALAAYAVFVVFAFCNFWGGNLLVAVVSFPGDHWLISDGQFLLANPTATHHQRSRPHDKLWFDYYRYSLGHVFRWWHCCSAAYACCLVLLLHYCVADHARYCRRLLYGNYPCRVVDVRAAPAAHRSLFFFFWVLLSSLLLLLLFSS